MASPRPSACLKFAAVLVAAVLLAPGSAQAAADPGAVPGELIVKFSGAADGEDRAAARNEADVNLERALPVPGVQLVKVQPGQSPSEAATQLERSPDVAYAEPNRYRTAATTPNDPYFGYLWGDSNSGQDLNGGTAGADIEAGDAWDVTTGSPAVTAAVIDSGIDTTHPDLSSQIWTNPGETGGGRESNGVDDDGDGLVDDTHGWDFVQGDNDPNDENGHGTHVSGTIAAAGNNGQGVAGVSWNSRVMPLRVLDANGNGSVAGLLQAYHYAAATGVRVVNLSVTGSDFSSAERDAIAAAPNTLFVVAAGNGGSDESGDDNDVTPQYPCSYPLPNVVCVAASDQSDNRARFSNYGAGSVDLAAPGTHILSTVPGGYAFYDGTSMATPQVTGVASLILSVRPSESTAGIKADLLGGADPAPAFAGITVSGGRLNANRSVRQQYARPPSPTAAAPAPAPARPAKPTPLKVFLKVRGRQRLSTIMARGLTLTTRCSRRCRVTLQVRLRSRSTRGARTARMTTRVVGKVKISLSKSRHMVVRLSRTGRKLVHRARRGKLYVSAVATDAVGTSHRKNVRVALHR